MLNTSSQVLASQMLSTIWRFQALILLVLIPVSWAHGVFWPWLVLSQLLLEGRCSPSSWSLLLLFLFGAPGMELSQCWKPNHLGFCFDFFPPQSFSEPVFWGGQQSPVAGWWWLKLWGAARHYRSSAGSWGLSCASQWSKSGLRRSVFYQQGGQSTMPKRSSLVYF